MMPEAKSVIEDLRGWLHRIEQGEQVKVVKGVDWDLEIGTIEALNNRRPDCPAIMFDAIRDCPPGHRLLCSSIVTPGRTAATLGLDPDSTAGHLNQMRRKVSQWEEDVKKSQPRVVKTGPVMQNIKSGEKVNLWEFPSPRWRPLDGGRYLGTGHAFITRDPDTGLVNLGTYRVMVHDQKTLGFHIAPWHHGRLHMQKYHDRGLACPILLSIGHHPLAFCVSCVPLPEGSEYQYWGAMSGQPVNVIEESVTGLPMPADSEIVIAGWCPPGEMRNEGPFGEFTGYYGGGVRPNPIIRVERVYHRDNPIVLASPPGRPPYNGSYYHALMHSSLVDSYLRKAGVPAVQGVWTHQICAYWFIVISVKQKYAGHAKQAALLAAEFVGGGRYVIVVDEDIDVTDLRHVVWAVATRADPGSGLDVIHRVRDTPLDPLIRKPATAFFMNRVTIDACKPFEWKSEFPETIELAPELEQKVKERWGRSLGL